MLFNSFQFAAFYLVIAATVFLVPRGVQWAFLLVASYYFYMCWNPWYVAVILAITAIDFVAGIRIEQSQEVLTRRAWLLVSLSANLGILFVFKYADFALESLQSVLRAFAITASVPHFGWLLPIGLSFHTFQAISYTIEVYRRRVPAERHLGRYALYVAFFPQMVAGPIERPTTLLPQLQTGKRFDASRLRPGLELVLWGLFKKMIIADSLAVIVNRVYGAPRLHGGSILAVATLCFTLQIYADFSGYSDRAVGLAKLLGYDLTINCRRPFFARSIAEFWRRWHISLMSWFRDCVYIPLGGSRQDAVHWTGAIMLVFLLSGVWHGAAWRFMIWGGLHGAYVVLGRTLAPVRSRLVRWSGLARVPTLHRGLQTAITVVLVAIAFVFFRAASLSDARYILGHIFRPSAVRLADLLAAGLPAFELATVAASIAVLVIVEALQEYSSVRVDRWWALRQVRWPAYAVLFYSLVFFGVFDRLEFVYFQS